VYNNSGAEIIGLVRGVSGKGKSRVGVKYVII